MGIFLAINCMVIALGLFATVGFAWHREWKEAALSLSISVALFAITVGCVVLVEAG